MNELFEYIIVGFGPAGILTATRLLAEGVFSKDIVAIDPKFTVGAIVDKWLNVPGNTKIKDFQRVNEGVIDIFKKIDTQKNKFEPKEYFLDTLDKNATCLLKHPAEPLQDFTDHLKKTLRCHQGMVNSITSDSKTAWTIMCSNGIQYNSKRVILASGGKPKKLIFPFHVNLPPELSLEDLFNESKLKEISDLKEKPIAIVGSSHTAFLVAKKVFEAGGSVIIFFNNTKITYAEEKINQDGTKLVINDNSGLKGDVATWTKEVAEPYLKGESSDNRIKFVLSNEETYKEFFPSCGHIVSAIGFEPDDSFTVNNLAPSQLTHDKDTGELSGNDGDHWDGLHGIGISFPRKVIDVSGKYEFAVGFSKFWDCLNQETMERWKNSSALYDKNLFNDASQINEISVSHNQSDFFNTETSIVISTSSEPDTESYVVK